MDPGGQLVTWQASAGVVYALDVVRIVPFFEANLGVLGLYRRTDPSPTDKMGKVEHSINVGAALGLGADYLVTRRWAVGIAIRYHAFLTDLSRIPIHLTVGRACWCASGFRSVGEMRRRRSKMQVACISCWITNASCLHFDLLGCER